MPYGNDNGLIGANIDQRLFVQDFSPYEKANERANASIASSINSAMSIGMDYAKEQKENKNALKASQAQIDAAITLFPDQAAHLSKVSADLKNEDKPLSERAAVAAGIGDMIMMGVGQQRYQTELKYKDREMNMRERESNLAQHVQSLQWDQAERQQKQQAVDDNTKAAIGPALLENAIGMLDKTNKPMADSIRASADTKDPAQAYSMANSIMGLIPKSERKSAPAVQEVAVPGGSLKMQWDEDVQKFVPIQTSGVPALPELPIYTEPDASAEDLSVLLPPLPGFAPNKPTSSPEQVQAAQIQKEKHDAETQAAQANKASSVAKSQELVATLDRLEKHAGFTNLFGTNIGTPTWIPGSAGADAKAVYDQLEGKGFIEAIQDMKGMGALSNAEGAKASAAFLGLSPSMSEAAAKSRIKELKELVGKGIARAAAGNLTATNGQAMPTPADPYAAATSRLNSIPQQ